MQAFLAKVVDIRYSGCCSSASLHWSVNQRSTNGSQPVFCRFDIHLAIEGHHFSLVPADLLVSHDKPRLLARESYEFNRDLLVVEQVGALEDDAERSFTDLLAHTVMHPDDVRRGRRGHRRCTCDRGVGLR